MGKLNMGRLKLALEHGKFIVAEDTVINLVDRFREKERRLTHRKLVELNKELDRIIDSSRTLGL
jgi:hypothetical protein